MARKATQSVTAAPTPKAGAAAAAAPAAAEQLGKQPVAPSESPAPGAVTPPAGTEQPVSEGTALEGGNTGQDAQPGTAPTAAVVAGELDDDGDVEGLWVTAIPEQGFRRCGYRFTREGFGIALEALTDEQIEQLENEPNLKVERGIFGGLVQE